MSFSLSPSEILLAEILRHTLSLQPAIDPEDGISRLLGKDGLATLHYGSKQGKIETLNYTLSHERGSERNERASKRVSAVERVSKASRVEQANE